MKKNYGIYNYHGVLDKVIIIVVHFARSCMHPCDCRWLSVCYCLWYSNILLQNHQTPLHLAAHTGHVEVLRVLIKGYHANKMVQAMVNMSAKPTVFMISLHMCI